MKKLLALLMAVAVTFQLVTPVFADTEGTEETTAPTEAVVETEAPTEAPAEETTAPTEATEETEEATEATEETVEDIALFADDGDVIASGECGKNGDNLTWVLTVDGTLTISGSGEMDSYSTGEAPWGTYLEQITAVVMESGVTGVGGGAFANCSNLISVMIPESVVSIGICAFQNCSSLTSMTIPEGVTDIGGSAFYGCSNLTSMTIPEGVTIIDAGTFSGCRSLTSVTIPDSVTSIGQEAFQNCSSLVSVTIPDGVTSIGYGTFEDCSSLTSVTIPDSVTSIEHYTFFGCSSLASVTIPDSVTRIEMYAFAYCDRLTSITIPKGVTYIGRDAFSGCSKLTSATILGGMCSIDSYAFSGCSSLTSAEGMCSIGSYAFSGCSSLTSVTITGGSIGRSAFENCSNLTNVTMLEGVTSIGWDAFSGCSSLTSVTIPGSVTSVGGNAFENCSSLTSVTMLKGVITIGGNAFQNCSNLTSVTIPDSVTKIGIAAFDGCSNLTSVAIPKGVTSIEAHAFENCSSLTSVTIPEGVTSIENLAFAGCSRLTSVTIPDGVISIGGSAFYDCSSLTSVTIPKSVTSIDSYAFSRCGRLTNVTIPKGVTSIANDTFFCCYELNDVEIPESVTSIGDNAFYNCSSLTSVTIPGGVTSIGSWAFHGCSSLTSVTIPKGVTSIGDYTFWKCAELAEVAIPESVTSIGDNAFYACSELKDVYYGGSDQQWKEIEIGSSNDDLTNATIHYGTHIHDMVKTEAVEPTYWSIGNNAYYTCSRCGKVFKDANGETETTVEDETLAVLPSIAHGTCGNEGDNLIWVLTEDGTLTISGSGNMKYYSESHVAPWYSKRAQILSVVVEPGVTSIGNYAFYACPKMTSVTLCRDVKYIGWYAFQDCTKLTAVEIPEGMTRIDWGTFCGCSSLTSVKIPEGVTSIEGNAFRDCSSLISVTIPESVTSIGSGAFSGCSSLTSVTIPEGVASIDDQVFDGCSSLTSVTIPDSVTSIGNYAFWGCSSLTSVMIPDGVISIGDFAFTYCSGLTSITIPEGVTSIGQAAFCGCRGLTSVTIPDGVTSIGNIAFADCSSLTSVTIPESVTSIGYQAFSDCGNLTSVTIPEGVTSIGYGTFQNCSSLASVTIPESVTSIGNQAFSDCSSLTGVTIPEGVTSIGDDAFWKCSKLTSVIIPAGVTSIGDSAFQGCSGLISVTISEGVTSIGNHTFEDCSSLTSVVIPGSVASISSYAFWKCSSLASVTIPKGVTSINDYAFWKCSSLTSVAIPESVTSIGDSAFNYCSKLKHVYYGGSDLQWKEIEIGILNNDLTKATIHYASTHAHNMEHIPGKAASCTETGNLEYWLCSICGEYFTDETFTKSTDEAGVTLPALGHAMTLKKAVKPTHKTAGNIEYYICSRCGKLFKDALGTEETTLEEVTLPVIPYVSKIILTRDGEPVPDTMEVDGRTGDTLTFAAVVQPEGAETKVKWSSGTPAVAQVDQDGVVTLLTSGTTVIKVAATDGSRVTAQVILNVTARDYAPRLGASTLILNSVSCAGVSVDLVESYGNQILSVSVDDERFDAEYADNLLTLTAREAVARGTYRMTLEAACDDGRTYSYPITVRVIQTLPRLAVRQSQRFNLFYRDSQAALTITGGEVESAELIGNSDFVLENEDGEWVIRYADPENAPAKPNIRATLSVSFAGYNTPVTRALTIITVNTAPRLTLNPASSTLNTALNSDWSVETVLSGTDGENLYAYTDTPGVDVELSGNVLTLTLAEAKNVSANVYVQDDNWTKPVKLTHRVTVTNRLPTLRAAAGVLKLNSWFPSETASTGMILSQGNVSLTDVELTPAAREGTAARAESDKLNVYYDANSGEIVAEIADPGIKNGTYSFTCAGILENGTEISGGTVRVTVSNTLPRVRLSAAMVRLNRQLAGEESIAVKVTLTGGDGYAIEGFEELPDCLDYADGILTATIPDADFTGGSYVLNAIVSRNGETAALPTGVSLRVQVYDRAPSFRLVAKGKLDVLDPASEIVYTPRLTNAQGTVTGVRLEGADAELFAAEVVDGVVHLTMAKGCTYSTRTTYKVIPVLTFCGQEVTGSALSIRVTQSILRLAALPNRTVYQSQTAPLVQVLSITSPATAEFGEITLNSRNTAALWNAVEAAGGIEVSGGVVRFPAKAFASLKPGRYTVILDVTPENAAADAKPIQARFTLTVQK